MNGVAKSGSVSPEAKYAAKGDSSCALLSSTSPLFSKATRAIVWGMQTRAVQVCYSTRNERICFYNSHTCKQ